jgi:membrane protein implicated in regulation of membrane protease activity
MILFLVIFLAIVAAVFFCVFAFVAIAFEVLRWMLQVPAIVAVVGGLILWARKRGREGGDDDWKQWLRKPKGDY